MKLKFQIIATTVALLFFISCNHDESQVPQAGQVAFSFNNQSNDVTGGRTQGQGTPAFVSYSLKKADGSTLNDKIELIEFNGDFLTSPQQLPTGSYTLEQFLILDANNQTIYAAPLLGSELADLVEHPLPLAFDITAEQTTNVVPEVLALEDHTPAEFGYVKFGFEVVDVAALRLPALPETEELEKISYQFSKGSTLIQGEVSPRSTLTIPELLGETWQATIQLWVKKECTQYQKLYRFIGELSFNGSVIRLPLMEQASSNWIPFFYKEVSDIKIFRSDPRNSYNVEIHLPAGIYGYGYVDRTFWDLEGNPTCDTDYVTIGNSPEGGIIKGFFPDIVCEITDLSYNVDSYLRITTSNSSESFESYFSWDIENDIVRPTTCTPL